MGHAGPSVWVRRLAPFLAFAVLAIGVLNFLWFMSETAPLNLIPSDGRVVDGQYYLWSKTHGGYVAVSASFWQWVRFHEPTVFLSWPFVMLAGASLVFATLSGRIGGLGRIESARRVQLVRDSGPLRASVRSAGVVGRIWFSRPLLRVEAYPAGLVIKPMFMAARAVLTSEVRAVESGGGLSPEAAKGRPVLGVGVAELSGAYRPTGPFVRIDHDGVGLASPIFVVGSGNWPLAQALRHVANGAASPTSMNHGPLASRSSEPDAWAESGHATGGTGDGRPSLPSSIEVGGAVLGVVMGCTLLWFGITVAIPQIGLFGLIWTVLLAAILAVNVRRLWARWSSGPSGWRATRDGTRKDGRL